ncbi:MAG: hypothetical protein K6F39_05850 [Lachnospiraceae bacterium]|nr:hypothetical protein [Lachnospiraceae bacterium]
MMRRIRNRENKDKYIADGGLVEKYDFMSKAVTIICVVIILLLLVLGALAIIHA